ncbi:MAG: DMT family transporter [Desulfovibrionaceae bacterium]|nr:DMT family transporter [Desulfovibrionaceae bacterium]
MRMTPTVKGYFYAALAAAFYGTNPIFTVPLYGTGMNAVSVLLFRYMLGIPLLAAIIVSRSERLALHRQECLPLALLGIMMGISSLALYESYNYMNPGVASTLLFMYPVLTALMMTTFFHEQFRLIIWVCLIIMMIGLYLLIHSSDGIYIDLYGVLLVFISSLTYAIYLVMIKVSKILPFIPTIKSLLYQLLFGGLVYICIIILKNEFVIPHTFFQWGNLAGLVIIPTVVSLIFTIKAIRHIGPTPTAIFGALEPVTAVVLSFLILGEAISTREILGGLFIVAATMLVALADSCDASLRRLRRRLGSMRFPR